MSPSSDTKPSNGASGRNNPPSQSPPSHLTLAGRVGRILMRAPIHLYRYTISPMIGPRCRFAPSCSEYALEAIALHGAAKGGVLAAKRIARCHPWGGSGYDPVPTTDGPKTASAGGDEASPDIADSKPVKPG